ncbi:hypothetical protein Ciccas_003920 [Cichlidogyrus casuarinus]|uniref:Guanine nucleotide-binding protein subunit gamma n=1 Tax=Cichlidogyrus casuarinus TaxID=1844966 RepID=A0ABD2QD13_9PLAT
MVKIYTADPKLGKAESVDKRVAALNRQLRSLEVVKEALEVSEHCRLLFIMLLLSSTIISCVVGVHGY